MLFVVFYLWLLVVVRCLLFAVCFFVVCCSLFVEFDRCSLWFVVRGLLLFGVCCVSVVVGCSLFLRCRWS